MVITLLNHGMLLMKNIHEVLEPIYKYVREIRKKEPERAKQIAQLCLELVIALKNLERR